MLVWYDSVSMVRYLDWFACFIVEDAVVQVVYNDYVVLSDRYGIHSSIPNSRVQAKLLVV